MVSMPIRVIILEFLYAQHKKEVFEWNAHIKPVQNMDGECAQSECGLTAGVQLAEYLEIIGTWIEFSS
jgi:hypothetical protein